MPDAHNDVYPWCFVDCGDVGPASRAGDNDTGNLGDKTPVRLLLAAPINEMTAILKAFQNGR